MRSLIFGDVHHKVGRVAWLLEHEQYDQAIALGDWFDDWKDGPKECRETATFLKEYFSDPRHLSLIGNHDLPYFWPKIRELQFWGWTRNKADTVTGILKPVSKYRKKMLYFLFLDGWLLTHAGLNIHLLPEQGIANRQLGDWLKSEVEKAHRGLYTEMVLPMFAAGKDRGGESHHGGILWNDWESLVPIPGVDQICGHTQLPGSVRAKHTAQSRNWCLDSNLRHYGILENGHLTIHELHVSK